MRYFFNIARPFVYILLYFILVCVSLVGDIDFIPLGLIMSFLILIAALIFWIILKLKSNRHAKKLFWIMIITFFSLVTIYPISHYCNTKTKEYADLIVVKINNYYFENGDYPRKLSDLIPKYIDKIPQTFYLRKGNFQYKLIIKDNNINRNSSDYFILKYEAPLDVTATYSSKSKSWKFDD